MDYRGCEIPVEAVILKGGFVMSENIKRDGVGYWIRIAIWLILSFSGWFIPAAEPITPYGMKILGIFLGLMFGWICLDLIFPSFFSVILVAVASGEAAKSLFYQGFSSDIVVTIIVLTTFCSYANKVGLDNVIAQWFIRIKFLKGRPWAFVTMFMVLIYVLGIMIDIYPTIFLLWPVIYKICDEAGFEHAGKFSSYMCFAITFISGLGMLSKPFSMWSVMGLNALNTFMGEGYLINYSLYTAYMIVVSAIIIITYLLIGKMMRLDLSPLKTYEIPEEKISCNKEQKICGVFFIAFFVLMYLPSLLPDDWYVTVLLNQLGVIGGTALLLAALGMCRLKGEKLCKIDNLAEIGVPWQIIFLMVANAVIGIVLESDEAGIIAWIHAVFGPMVQGLSVYVFLCAFNHIVWSFNTVCS
jgi:solute carrier family 13 (sodium-dependent dicarboxylate transporter), member 2/3/5